MYRIQRKAKESSGQRFIGLPLLRYCRVLYSISVRKCAAGAKLCSSRPYNYQSHMKPKVFFACILFDKVIERLQWSLWVSALEKNRLKCNMLTWNTAWPHATLIAKNAKIRCIIPQSHSPIKSTWYLRPWPTSAGSSAPPVASGSAGAAWTDAAEGCEKDD